MYRFQFCRKSVFAFFIVFICILGMRSALAASCNRDAACARTVSLAESAISREDRLTAISNLKAAYERVPDPRLLVSIGNLHQKVGQSEYAKEFCMRAQSQAPSDVEIQERTKECLIKANASRQNEMSKPPTVTGSRVDARSGASNAESSVHSEIKVTPQLSMAPSIQISPHIQVGGAFENLSTQRQPIYRYWWFWTLVGGSAVAVAAIGLGAGLSSSRSQIPSVTNTYTPVF